MTKIGYENVLSGFLLLLLAICGNFLGNTFGCQLYDKLTNNTQYKNILVFLLIYFTIYFAERRPEHPGISALKAVILYCFYLIFVKQKPKTLVLGLLLLVAAFVCEQYKDYHDNIWHASYDDIEDEDATIDSLEVAQIILASLCVVISIIGFGVAYREQRQHNKQLTFVQYIFRDFTCVKI